MGERGGNRRDFRTKSDTDFAARPIGRAGAETAAVSDPGSVPDPAAWEVRP
jgi:hypothetical protein